MAELPSHTRRPAGDPRVFARTSIARLFELVRAERDHLRLIVIYAFGVGILAIATPVAVQSLVNFVAFGGVMQPIIVLSALLFGCLALAAAMRAAQAWIVEVLQRRLFARATHWIAQRIPGPETLADRSTYHPERVNRILEVFSLQKSAASLLLSGIDAVLTVVVGMVVLAFYHPILLAFDVLLVLALLGLVLGLGRDAPLSALAESSAKYKWLEWVEARAIHRTAARTGPFADYSVEHLTHLGEKYLAARETHFRKVFRQTAAALGLQALASAIVLAIGGFLVVQRELTLGQLVAAELVVAGVVASISKFGKLAETYYDAVASVSKLDAVANLSGLEREGVVAERVGPGFSVRIEPSPGAPAAARDGIVEVASGSAAAVLVRDAEDAARMLAALRGDADVACRVVLSGVDARDWSSESLDRTLAHIHRGEVFPASVMENVAGTAQPDEDLGRRVVKVLDALGIGDAVSKLEGGLHHVLRVDGFPLDARAALRLTVARTIVGGARLVVIDRALDALSDAEALELLAVIQSGLPSATLLVLTERASLRDALGKRWKGGVR